jgi:hypothetical protein
MPWMQTYTGQKLNCDCPDPQSIDIIDIAVGLSRLARYAGQTKVFYSVAQHSVYVADLVGRRGGTTSEQLIGLLHDAPEAYLGDLVRPVKMQLPGFVELEEKLWNAISTKLLGWPLPIPEIVHVADRTLLVTEARDLLPRGPLDNWTDRYEERPLSTVVAPVSMHQAERMFLNRFHKLSAMLSRQAVSA